MNTTTASELKAANHLIWARYVVDQMHQDVGNGKLDWYDLANKLTYVKSLLEQVTAMYGIDDLVEAHGNMMKELDSDA